jgi:bifunctional DNase/RNase
LQVEVHVEGINTDPRDGTPVVILKDRTQERFLPLWIAPHEARQLAELGQKDGGGAGWDLLCRTLNATGARLVGACLVGQKSGRVLAEIILEQGESRVAIGARAIDAVALAHITKVPLTVDNRLLEQMHHWVKAARNAAESDLGFVAPHAASAPSLSHADRWNRLLAQLGAGPSDTTYDA